MTENLQVLNDEASRWSDDHRTLSEAIDFIRDARDLDGEREDVDVSDVRSLAYGGNEAGIAVLASSDPPRMMPLRASGFDSLAAKIGAPARFLARMPRDLQVPVVLWGLSRVDDAHAPAKLRLAGGEVRAIVSARYAVLDHVPAAETMAAALDAAGLSEQATVVSTATGPSLVMRCLWRSRDVATRDGSTLSIGLDLTNGEIANRSAGLAPVVYHGAAAAAARKAAWRRRHFGDVAVTKLRDELVAAIPQAMAAAESLRDLVLRAETERVDDAIEDAEALTKIGLSVTEAREVVRGLLRGRGLDVPNDTASWPAMLGDLENVTVYEVWRALIETAKGRGVDRRLDVEDAAARYLAARLR